MSQTHEVLDPSVKEKDGKFYVSGVLLRAGQTINMYLHNDGLWYTTAFCNRGLSSSSHAFFLTREEVERNFELHRFGPVQKDWLQVNENVGKSKRREM